MADKTVRPKIETAPAAGGAAAPAAGTGDKTAAPVETVAAERGEKPVADAAAAAPVATPEPPANPVTAWVNRTFPGHAGAFWGGVCGLLAAVCLFVLGIFKTVVIAALVLVGVAVGQFADGDPKLVNLVRRLFSGGQN